MDILGIGPMELIMVLLVAMLVLGPSKSITMARSAGKIIGEVRRAMGDLSKAIEEEELASGPGVATHPVDGPQQDSKQEDRD